MGGGTYDPNAYAGYTRSIHGKSTQQVFQQTALGQIHKSLDPKGIVVRESRDGPDHPASNAIIVGVDVTGSMGILAETIAHQGLGTLFQETLDRNPVPDPQLMFMAIGDVNCDTAPLQVSQFESSNVIVQQLENIFLEGGGGGNGSETYTLPWYFAARHTSIDCFEKRQKKGYLFTIGDDGPNPILRASSIFQFVGDDLRGEDVDTALLFTEVSRMYHVFHLHCTHGSRSNYGHSDGIYQRWQALLGERALLLEDHTKLAEVIVSTIQIIEGADVKTVAASWSGDTALVVANATRSLAGHSGSGKVAKAGGVHRF